MPTKNNLPATVSPLGKFPSRKEEAAYWLNMIKMGEFAQMIGLKQIHDKRLYVEWDCGSFKEFIETMTNIGRTQAYRHLKFAEKFGPLLIKENDTCSKLEHDMSNIFNMGVTTLEELIRLDDEDFKELIGGGSLKMEDEKTITISELLEMGAMKATVELAEYRRKSNKEIQRLKEDVKLAQAEKEAAEAMNLEVEKRLKLAKELEKKYGEVAWKLEDKREVLEKARKLLYDSEIFFFKLNLTEEDPQSLIEDVLKFVQYVDGYHRKMMTHFAFLLDVIEA